ncbi:matrix-remodeling-associated protein 7 [Amazona aestiva]|uniref:Matrix-remodeling-associated protein 7 n=1 Tax=Amazona aestiva TaxID=12930 RepID=A0A0Q3PSQ1_AMAAE|nr:matrix-remodeling-associated protein 7 [Amazona aestiva]
MNMAMDLYLAVRLLFTILALILTFVFVRLQGAEGEQPQEPPAATLAWESGPRDQEARKESAAEQREEAAVELSSAAERSPVATESIPWQPPTEPWEPEPQEDAGGHAAFPSKAEEEDLDSDKEELVVREPASTAATPAPVTSTAASFESSEGFEWTLGTLETCLLIVMGITMLARIQSVFYP